MAHNWAFNKAPEMNRFMTRHKQIRDKLPIIEDENISN